MNRDSKNEEQIEAIKAMNKKWYNHRIFLAESLALGVLTFIGGFYGPLTANQGPWFQALFFVFASGFFVVVLSYLFNLLWLLSLKSETKRDKAKERKDRKQAVIDFYMNWKNRLFYSLVIFLQSGVVIILILMAALGIMPIAYTEYAYITVGLLLFANIFLFIDRFTIIFIQNITTDIENKQLFILKSIGLYLLLLPLYPIFLLLSLVDIFRSIFVEDKESNDLFTARSKMYIEIFQ